MQRVLLVGCGDVALRVADLLRGRVRLLGLTRNRDDVRKLRQRGVVPIDGDLDDRRTLSRLDLGAFAVVHCAPPPSDGKDDPRTRNLLAALSGARIIPRRFSSSVSVDGWCGPNSTSPSRTRPLHVPHAPLRQP